MANDRIKVPGYAKKETFNGNIEYRNFADDLVGFQLTSENASFTLGNFAITSSLDPRVSKLFRTNKFSPFVTLCDLDLTLEEAEILLTNNSEVKLKLDKSNLCNYAYFGSLLEYIRVSLEDVITKWPASLHTNPVSGNIANNLTVEDYLYNAVTDISTFKISTNVVENPYSLNFLQNGTVVNTFNEGNDLRNITVNYLSYSVLRDDVEYELLDFTGSTVLVDDYLFLTVKGDPFNDITGTTATTEYHIKPNKLKEDEFFANLPDFQSNLLNRTTVPKYSSTYKTPHRSEDGSLIFRTNTLTWPVSDGYNIDFNSTKYTTFVNDLITLGNDLDVTKTNLMTRFLTAEAISDFDTVPRCDGIDPDEETAGQKMNKTLKIYGREYDEIKRYIDGIQYANTVSYDQVNNTPDAILKYLARTLGWELVSSILENDLLKNYVETKDSTYSGQSVGLTAVEAEVEMWRRLILNSPWLWKSKGARKGIEFLFKFIGAPDGLIEFNEFIYLAREAIDVDLFKQTLIANGLEPDLDDYNLDNDGYPRVPLNNKDMYFQKGGLWYRQTAGSASTLDILVGNNPHVGPYDGGAAYINQFQCLIPDFSAVTLSSSTTVSDTENIFTNYQSGTINDYEGDYFVDVETEDEIALDDCVVVTTTKILDPFPTPSELTDCGCEIDDDDYALMICIDKDEANNDVIISCNDSLAGAITQTDEGWMLFEYKTYDQNGDMITGLTNTSFYASKECCDQWGGTSYFYEDFSTPYQNNTPATLINCGFVCCPDADCGCGITCKWKLAGPLVSDMVFISSANGTFLKFQKPDGSFTTSVPTGCSCIQGYTRTVVNVLDPFTGQLGTACELLDAQDTNGLGDMMPSFDDTWYGLVFNQATQEWEVVTWIQTYDAFGAPIGSPPAGYSHSYLWTIYEGRANGQLPCDKDMNAGGLTNDPLGGELSTF